MIELVDFDKLPPESVRLAWCDWLRHHTIDPDYVAVPGFVEVDYATYRIRYLAYDRDDQGRKHLTPDGTRAAMSERTLQLEACPSPLPDTATIGHRPDPR